MDRRLARVALAAILCAVVSSPQTAGAAFVLRDVYIPMDDGVALAADIHLPADPATSGPWPCLVELTPYRKETRAAEGASLLPEEGFVLIEVDARGTGGSEGEYDIVFSVREQWDGAAVIDWAASQTYCTPKVGMFGGSYSGIIQLLVASLEGPRAPRHLAAIAPQRAYGDLYRDIVYHGGQLISEFGVVWSAGTSAYYVQPPTNAGSEQGNRSWLDHVSKNDVMLLPYLQNPYADANFTADDSPAPGWSQKLYADSSVLSRIEQLRVPTLHLAGWFDSFTRGQLLTFQRALEHEASTRDYGPHCLIIGPWNHTGTHFITPENGGHQTLLDWYRHFLTDDPGHPTPECLTAPDKRLRYYEIGEGALDDATGVWRTAAAWPLSDTELEVRRLYLRAGGALEDSAPGSEGGSSTLANPASGHAEISSRWLNAAGAAPWIDQDQRTEAAIALTFETPILETELKVVGPIALRLWATVTGASGDPSLAAAWPGVLQATPPYLDVDFVAKLNDVAPDGTSTIITQGYLRASHRAVDPEGSVEIDGERLMPFHPHTLAALDPPRNDQPAFYEIEIWPTAKTFRPGHRIQLVLSLADTPNHLNVTRPALARVLHRAGHDSHLALPVRASGP